MTKTFEISYRKKRKTKKKESTLLQEFLNNHGYNNNNLKKINIWLTAPKGATSVN